MNKKGFGLIGILLAVGGIALLVGGVFVISDKDGVAAVEKKNEPIIDVLCPFDTKICPDGSAVGRELPRCEFAECPPPFIEDESGNGIDEEQASVLEKGDINNDNDDEISIVMGKFSSEAMKFTTLKVTSTRHTYRMTQNLLCH